MKLFVLQKVDYLVIFLIFLVTVLFVLDLFLTPGRPANMDGIVHTITPALFADAIKGGEFPVSWINGFANYGLPLGMIAHQLTTYLTAIFNIVFNNPPIAYNIVAGIGALLSALFYYFFLRIYFLPLFAFLGVFLFSFSPYRILNLHIRGALPEFFAGVFVPLILIGIYMLVKQKNIIGFFLLASSYALLILTHPFMFVISFFITVPYLLYLLLEEKLLVPKNYRNALKTLIVFSASVVVGLGITSYYIIPLNIEIKYFYYGLAENHLTPGNFLGIENYITSTWEYFSGSDVFNRGFYLNVGIVETVLVVLSAVLLVINLLLNKRKYTISLFDFAVIASILTLFFTSSAANVFYQNVSILSNIQFPWRMLSVFIFLPPILLAYLLSQSRNSFLIIGVVIVVSVMSFQQLYAKNSAIYPPDYYSFTPLNLHAVVMNPIWSERSEDYPVKKNKIEIIGGNGEVINSEVGHSWRKYIIRADSPIHVIDYTFYFPGWKVYVDGVEQMIQFQDPNHRGVITYSLENGTHEVLLQFEDTKIRFISKILSVLFVVAFVILFLARKMIKRFIMSV